MAAGLSSTSEVRRAFTTSSPTNSSSPTSTTMELTPSSSSPLTRLISDVSAHQYPPHTNSLSTPSSVSIRYSHLTSPIDNAIDFGGAGAGSSSSVVVAIHPADYGSASAGAAAPTSTTTAALSTPTGTAASAAPPPPLHEVNSLQKTLASPNGVAPSSAANQFPLATATTLAHNHHHHRDHGAVAQTATCINNTLLSKLNPPPSSSLSPNNPQHIWSPTIAVKHQSKLMVGLVNTSSSLKRSSTTATTLPPPLGLIKQPPPLHINNPHLHQQIQDNNHMDIEDSHKKRRCTDRYDSSESSDSGLATLSCTDSSTASSDGSDPGSPYSPSSTPSCDDPSQQSIVGHTLPALSTILPNSKTILTPSKNSSIPHVWPWSNNFSTQPPQLTISTTTSSTTNSNPPPLAKAGKRSSTISISDRMAASIKKIRTASTKPLALVAAAPKTKPMPPLATPIYVTNPQTKITGFFKSQIKPNHAVKRDLTNLVVRSTDFPMKDAFGVHSQNSLLNPVNITAMVNEVMDVRTAHITTSFNPMPPTNRRVDRKTAKVAPLVQNTRKLGTTSPEGTGGGRAKPVSIAPRVEIPVESTAKKQPMVVNKANVILASFRIPPQQQMVAPMQYITSNTYHNSVPPPPPPVPMTSAKNVNHPIYHQQQQPPLLPTPPLVMPKLIQIPKEQHQVQQSSAASQSVRSSGSTNHRPQPHYILNGPLLKLQNNTPETTSAHTSTNMPFLSQTNNQQQQQQSQFATQPQQLFMTSTPSGLFLSSNGIPTVLTSSPPMKHNPHAGMPALHPYSQANFPPDMMPSLSTLLQNQPQSNYTTATSSHSVFQQPQHSSNHHHKQPMHHLQPNQMSLVVSSHAPTNESTTTQKYINTKVIKPQIRYTCAPNTSIQSNTHITTLTPISTSTNSGGCKVPRHSMSTPPPLISSNTPPPLCISKPFVSPSSTAPTRLVITTQWCTKQPLPPPTCLPMLTPINQTTINQSTTTTIQTLPEVIVSPSQQQPTTVQTQSHITPPLCPPCLQSPKSLVLDRIQRLKPEDPAVTASITIYNNQHFAASSLPTVIDTDLLSVALPECAKSPILSPPKTIRFPAVGSSRSGIRRSDGRLVGVCYWDGCDEKYDTSSKLLDHLQTQHVNTQTGPFACEWSACKVHSRESCSRRWLERHVLSHGGTKQFKCIVDGCDARFGSQITLEKHVNGHFNGAETKEQTSRRLSDPPVPKKLRGSCKKLRYRRQPFSARLFDFFDNGIMEVLQHRLSHTELTVNGNRGSVVFTGSQIGRRVTGVGSIEHLIRWSPPEIIPDEWMPESSCMLSQPSPSMSASLESSSGSCSSASSVSSASFTLNSNSTTSTSISKSVRIQSMAQSQRIALQGYLRTIYQNGSNHPHTNSKYNMDQLLLADVPLNIKKNRRKCSRKSTDERPPPTKTSSS